MPPRRRPRPRRSASRRRGRRSPRATGQRLPVRDPEEATMAETSLTEQLRALADQARDLAKMASDAASRAGQQVAAAAPPVPGEAAVPGGPLDTSVAGLQVFWLACFVAYPVVRVVPP